MSDSETPAGAADAAPGYRRLVRRRARALLAALALSAALGTAGFAAGVTASEPRARDRAPEPSVLTVPVEERVLSVPVVTRATLESARSTEVRIRGTAPDGLPRVVTALDVASGDLVEEGDVLVELSGRPVVVLRGDIPTFRDVTLGATGPDVEQLQRALARLDHTAPAVTGTYDAATAGAVASLFDRTGYGPPAPSTELRAEQARLQDELAAATAEEENLRLDLAAAEAPAPESERLAAELAVDEARNAALEAEAALDDAELDLEAARAQLAEAETVAAAGADPAPDGDGHGDGDGDGHGDGDGDGETDGQGDGDGETDGQGDGDGDGDGQGDGDGDGQGDGDGDGETDGPGGQPPAGGEGGDGTPTVEQAEAAVAAAERAVERARAALDVAEARVLVARARADELGGGGPHAAGVAAQLSATRERIAELRTRLAELPTGPGEFLRAAEIAFVPALPARVTSVPAVLGEPATEDLVTLSSGGMIARMRLPAGSARRVEPGDRVELVDDGDGGTDGDTDGDTDGAPRYPDGTVTSVAADDRQAGMTVVEAELTGEPPPGAPGTTLRAVVHTASTREPVLAVPLAAVSGRADGSAEVTVVHPDGDRQRVRVTVGVSDGDAVELVAPPDVLRPGTAVLIGDR